MLFSGTRLRRPAQTTLMESADANYISIPPAASSRRRHIEILWPTSLLEAA